MEVGGALARGGVPKTKSVAGTNVVQGNGLIDDIVVVVLSRLLPGPVMVVKDGCAAVWAACAEA